MSRDEVNGEVEKGREPECESLNDEVSNQKDLGRSVSRHDLAPMTLYKERDIHFTPRDQYFDGPDA